MVFIFPFLLLSCFLEVPTRVPLFNFLCQALHDDIKNTNFANCICQLMIKKIIIRILSIVMLIAFIAVVSVQWIWMKYSMREGEARFTSKVYDVLGKAVSLVDQVSERKLYQEVKEQYNILEEQIAATDQMLDSLEKGKEQRLRTNSASVSIEMQQANGQVTIRHMSVGYQDPLEEYSRYLQEISRSIREVTDRSFPHQLIKSEEEEVKQQTDSLDGQRLSDMIRKVVIRYMKEEDPSIFANGCVDYLGINAYNRYIAEPADGPETNLGVNNTGDGKKTKFQIGNWFSLGEDSEMEKTPWGMEINPRSIYDLLMDLKRLYPQIPVIITENGVGNYDEVVDGQIHDQYRIAYLEGYVDWIERAMEDGCTVLGYFVWSTMDVYSWINGYKKRYGLVYIDYDSDDLVRIPKDSYYWYKNKIQNRRKSFNGKIHSIY